MAEFKKNFFESLQSLGDETMYSLLELSGNLGENFLFFLLERFGRGNLNDILEATSQVKERQNKLLLDIINLQKYTEYGKKYNFSQIKSLESFKKIHPLTTYKDYAPILQDVEKTGNYKKLVAEPIVLFQKTPGTDGEEKLIPRTKSFSQNLLKTAQATAGVIEAYLEKKQQKTDRKQYKALTLTNAEELEITASGIPKGTAISGGIRQNIKYKSVQKILNFKSASPSLIILISDSKVASYCHLLFGLIETDLTFISVSLGAFNLLAALQLLEEKWTQLVEDIKKGKIDNNLSLESSIRQQLESYLAPNPQRAKILKNEFEKGFDNILARIWPKLSHIQLNTIGESNIFKDKLKRYTKNIPIFYSIYGLSEAFIGINLEPDKNSSVYAIPPDSALFEFILISKDKKKLSDTLSLSSLSVGDEYEVVVTTIGGLCRYRTGNVIKCVGHYNQTPLIEFKYCKDYLLNIYGEKISENTLFEVLQEALIFSEGNIEIIDFTTKINIDLPIWNYVIYLEISKSLEKESSLKKIENRVEEIFYNSNYYYKKARKNKKLGKIKVNFLQKGTFKQFKEKFFKQTDSKTVTKISRLVEKAEMIKFLNQEIIQ